MGKIKVTPLTRSAIKKAERRAKAIAAAPSAVIEAKMTQIDGQELLRLKFRDGKVFMLPSRSITELAGAARDQLRSIVISPLKDSIAFPKIDVHIYVPGLLAELMSPIIRPEFSRQAGRRSTTKKAAAARENGKRGGRRKREKAGGLLEKKMA
jgi:hypothetical protein